MKSINLTVLAVYLNFGLCGADIYLAVTHHSMFFALLSGLCFAAGVICALGSLET